MQTTASLSVPNLFIALAMFLVLFGGVLHIVLKVRALSKDLKKLEQGFHSLGEAFQQLAPPVAGELLVRQELKEWEARLLATDAKTELLEKRMNVVDADGSREGHG